MSYPNFMGQNPYYPQYQGNMMNQYPSHFVNAMQQNYGLPQQSHPQQQQQTITTQPPIMQPSNSGSKIIPVSNKEEATASPVDLVNGTPSFFFNREKNEVYYKQFDVPTGKGIFKTYVEVPMQEETPISEGNTHTYEREFEYLKEGIDGLYRKLEQLKQPVYIKEANVEELEIEEPKPQRGKKNA